MSAPSDADENAFVPTVRPFKPHRAAFWIITAILIAWIGFLIYTYFTAVHHRSPQPTTASIGEK